MSVEPDMQMVRTSAEGGWSLALGEPVLLQDHLLFYPLPVDGAFAYPPITGDPVLVKELSILYPGFKHIVITNGAKQALLAAFYAFKNKGKTEVLHEGSLYWPSYPTLSKMSGLRFRAQTSSSYDYVDQIRCVTSPNNPDGTEYDTNNKLPVDIHDAVYDHWIYNSSGIDLNPKVKIGGAAKLIGASGARVGWLLTNDDQIARDAEKYVEFTTSGVSAISQQYIASCLTEIRVDPLHFTSSFFTIKTKIEQNFSLCNEIFGCNAKSKGMFAWIGIDKKHKKDFDRVLLKTKVTLVNGEACGGPNNYYRINMAHRNDYTRQALMAIKENF